MEYIKSSLKVGGFVRNVGKYSYHELDHNPQTRWEDEGGWKVRYIDIGIIGRVERIGVGNSGLTREQIKKHEGERELLSTNGYQADPQEWYILIRWATDSEPIYQPVVIEWEANWNVAQFDVYEGDTSGLNFGPMPQEPEVQNTTTVQNTTNVNEKNPDMAYTNNARSSNAIEKNPNMAFD
jgi:hypothetical protein